MRVGLVTFPWKDQRSSFDDLIALIKVERWLLQGPKLIQNVVCEYVPQVLHVSTPQNTPIFTLLLATVVLISVRP